MIHIEFVCTGNNGRSPMAETIARDYVMRNDLADLVDVSSSGSGLHQKTAKTGEAKVEEEKGLVKLALQNRIYQEAWRPAQVEKALAGDRSLLTELFEYAIRVEAILRDRVLFDVDLVATGKYHQPTEIAYDDKQRIILPMAESNAAQVRKIYEGSDVRPTIVALNQYADLPGDVPNPFCQLEPAYVKSRDHLLTVVPRTIDRAVREMAR